jgi:hypothetical protein
MAFLQGSHTTLPKTKPLTDFLPKPLIQANQEFSKKYHLIDWRFGLSNSMPPQTQKQLLQ